MDRLLDRCQGRIRDVEIAGFEQVESVNWKFLASEAASRYAATIDRQPDLYTAGFRQLVEKGKRLTPQMLDDAAAVRGQFREALADALRQVDVLVTPTMPQGLSATDKYGYFTAAFNLAGWPAVSIPAGFLGDGTPIGVQFAAGPGQDALLLSLAAAHEEASDWHRRIPATFSDT